MPPNLTPDLQKTNTNEVEVNCEGARGRGLQASACGEKFGCELASIWHQNCSGGVNQSKCLCIWQHNNNEGNQDQGPQGISVFAIMFG